MLDKVKAWKEAVKIMEKEPCASFVLLTFTEQGTIRNACGNNYTNCSELIAQLQEAIRGFALSDAKCEFR